MKRKTWIVVASMFLLVALFVGGGVRRSWAHATCTQSHCCSPHGALSSSTGCSFHSCSLALGEYDRNICCPPSSQGNKGNSNCYVNGLYFGAGASADADHNVSVNGGNCMTFTECRNF
jgi:hypothetical protein